MSATTSHRFLLPDLLSTGARSRGHDRAYLRVFLLSPCSSLDSRGDRVPPVTSDSHFHIQPAAQPPRFYLRCPELKSAKQVRAPGKPPSIGTKCAQQLCACFSARPNLLHGVARLRQIISAARHHSRVRGQAQRAAASRTCDQRLPSCAVEHKIAKKDK